MEVTLADSILMTSNQGLLVIHLPSLHRASMATAAGLSCPSWMYRCIPFEWCMVWKTGENTVLLLTFACVSQSRTNDSAAGNLKGQYRLLKECNGNRHIWRTGDIWFHSYSPRLGEIRQC